MTCIKPHNGVAAPTWRSRKYCGATGRRSMSILGAIVRAQPRHLSATSQRLRALPGVEIAVDPGDGRLVLLLEDLACDDRSDDLPPCGADSAPPAQTAAETLAAIAMWPEVICTSLVFEYSGPDVHAPLTAPSRSRPSSRMDAVQDAGMDANPDANPLARNNSLSRSPS